jgi:putative inorganic carbon (hco3(-)) transporter
MLQVAGLFRMEMLRRRFRKATDPAEAWIAPLASALQHGHIIYLVGALFIAIAFQPFVYMLLAAEIGLNSYVLRTRPNAIPRPMAGAAPVAA